jgi:hypothetical protein
MRAARMLVRGRRLAEELMTDWCVAGTQAPGDVLDEVTGEYDPVFTPLYTGPCRFKAGTTAVGEIDAQGQLLIEQDSVISFPMAASEMLGKDHIVHMMGSETDFALIGVKARIKGPFTSSYTTARRFSVEVTT